MQVAFTLIGGGKGTGGYNYLLNLVRLLNADSSNRVTPVLFLGTDVSADDSAPFQDIQGLQIVRSTIFNRTRKLGSLAASLILGRDAAMRTTFREQNIDVAFESAQFFGWRLGIPVIAWIPDFQHRRLRHMFSQMGYWKREFGFQVQIASGRLIMLSSDDARTDCELFYPRTVGRTSTVRFAVSPQKAPSLAEARMVASNYRLPADFIFVPNQFSKHKNHLLILAALGILRERGMRVFVVSSGKQSDERHPEYFSVVKAKIEKLGMQNHFRMLGVIPYCDIAALMRSSTALLNPSLFEGWSTPVEEARALGVPLILSDLDVHREQAGEAARYFDRYDPSSLANAIEVTRPQSDADRELSFLKAQRENRIRIKRYLEDFSNLVARTNTKMRSA